VNLEIILRDSWSIFYEDGVFKRQPKRMERKNRQLRLSKRLRSGGSRLRNWQKR
jgi:hypothetical protein